MLIDTNRNIRIHKEKDGTFLFEYDKFISKEGFNMFNYNRDDKYFMMHWKKDLLFGQGKTEIPANQAEQITGLKLTRYDA